MLNYAIVKEKDESISITLDRDNRKMIKDGFTTVTKAMNYCEKNIINFKG
ncbi:hypothetical protein [Paraliobacillus ryukyuensis]|nr:hypothetical protein [Paraliobacillus ryukyuensis]